MAFYVDCLVLPFGAMNILSNRSVNRLLIDGLIHNKPSLEIE